MFHAARLFLVRSCLVLLAVIPLSGTGALAQAPQAVRGTTVSVTPPQGFAPAPGFSGFASADGLSSLMVTELPIEAYDKIAAMFADLGAARAALAPRGITVTGLDQVTTGAGRIPLISGTQTVKDQVFRKWLMVLKGEKTVLITLQAPEGSKLNAAAVKQSLATLKLGKEPSLADKVASLPFAISASAPFRVVNTIAGSAVIMTAGERDVDPQGTQPLIVVASQLSAPIDPSQRQQVARALLETTHGLENATVDGETSVPFAGADGLLLTGTTADGRRFSQYLAFGAQGRFIRLMAIVPQDRLSDTKNSIEQIAKSITFKG
ncbi:hypothetical protein [Azorhizobium sp. AG788]|uniref:hypothetical protein n=1 Tax=Azorhizobium sp. AG788 TaxID=2183897 RepID=UPI0031387F9D